MIDTITVARPATAELLHEGDRHPPFEPCMARIYADCGECGARSEWCTASIPVVASIMAGAHICAACRAKGAA